MMKLTVGYNFGNYDGLVIQRAITLGTLHMMTDTFGL